MHKHTFGYLTNSALLVNHFVRCPEGHLVPSPAPHRAKKERKKEARESANECTISLKAFLALA